MTYTITLDINVETNTPEEAEQFLLTLLSELQRLQAIESIEIQEINENSL